MTQAPMFTLASNLDVGELAYYNFPAGSMIGAFVGKDSNGTERKWMIIVYLGSAAFSSANYNNAPIGSFLVDTTAGAVKIYQKTAATTWTAQT